MKKKFTMSILLILVLALSNLSWAGHGDRGGHHKGKGGGPMKFLEKLDLTDDQQSKVDAIMQAHQAEKNQLREDIKTAKKALREAMHADTFDEAAIRSASKTVSTNMEEMAVFRGKIFTEIRSILTPEQIEKMSEMRMHHQKKMKCREKCGEECGEMMEE